MDNERHHIWCNFFMTKKPSECEMCKRFNEKYPEGDLTEDELQKKYFPDAIIRNTSRSCERNDSV